MLAPKENYEHKKIKGNKKSNTAKKQHHSTRSPQKISKAKLYEKYFSIVYG